MRKRNKNNRDYLFWRNAFGIDFRLIF
jgi:hypothetical protein